MVLTGAIDEHGQTQSVTAATVLIGGIAASCDASPGDDTQTRRAREWDALGVAVLAPSTGSAAPQPDPLPVRQAPALLSLAEGAAADRAVADRAVADGVVADGVVSFDSLAHTVTCDGDLPRCAECGEYGSHSEHQPEALIAGCAPRGRGGTSDDAEDQR